MTPRLPGWLHGRAAWWVGAPLVLGLLVAFSLEEVTDSPPPLDPRFVQGGGASGVGPGPGLVPFSDYDGDMVVVKGTLIADAAGALDLDLWKVDPSAPGSRTHLGKVAIEGPGPFQLEVPVDFGILQIESFRDLNGDGPSMDDPFGRTECEVGSGTVDGVELVLELGGMGQHHGGPLSGGPDGTPSGGPDGTSSGGPEHQDMPPGGEGGEGGEAGLGAEHQEAAEGAPGGEDRVHVEMPPGGGEADPPPSGSEDEGAADAGAADAGAAEHVEAPPGAPGGGDGPVHDPAARPDGAAPGAAPSGAGRDPFASIDGPRVVVSGTIVYANAAAVMDLDIFRNDPSGPGGRAFVGKKKLSPGPFELNVPRSFGKISLEVFLDATGDGPSADDPFAACPCNPLNLSRGDVHAIEIHVE